MTANVTHYLQLFDALKVAVVAGDRETEESTYAALRQLLNELTQEERWSMSHPMITKYKELSEIYASAATSATRGVDDVSRRPHETSGDITVESVLEKLVLMSGELARKDVQLAQLEEHRAWADGEIARLRGVVRKYEEAAEVAEAAEASPGPRKMARNEFTIDFNGDDDDPTDALFIMRGERSVLLEVRAFANEDRQITRYENSITCCVATPSLERFRDGFRGEMANDVSERVVPNARAEDLIVALQWLLEKKASPTKEAP